MLGVRGDHSQLRRDQFSMRTAYPNGDAEQDVLYAWNSEDKSPLEIQVRKLRAHGWNRMKTW